MKQTLLKLLRLTFRFMPTTQKERIFTQRLFKDSRVYEFREL